MMPQPVEDLRVCFKVGFICVRYGRLEVVHDDRLAEGIVVHVAAQMCRQFRRIFVRILPSSACGLKPGRPFVRFGYHGGTAMKPDYSRIPRHTLKTLEAWIATAALLFLSALIRFLLPVPRPTPAVV